MICPLAIVIVSIGKHHGPSWAILHKRLQLYVVAPMLVSLNPFSLFVRSSPESILISFRDQIICVTLGYGAGLVSPKGTPLDAHKVFGLIMIASIGIALVTGDYTFTKYFSPKPSKPRKKSPMSIWLHVQGESKPSSAVCSSAYILLRTQRDLASSLRPQLRYYPVLQNGKLTSGLLCLGILRSWSGGEWNLTLALRIND